MSKLIDSDTKFTKNDSFKMPGFLIPVIRTMIACEKGVNKNILITTWGGIGDQICAEPTIRYAIEEFNDCKITLASELPELYRHLKFHSIYNLKDERPIIEDYLVFDTIPQQRADQTLMSQFISHMLTNCVDFPSLSAFRCQLPISRREVKLDPKKPDNLELLDLASNRRNLVAIHAGKHWQSKTFPVEWWNAVIDSLISCGLTPVLVGKTAHEDQGFVDTKNTGCIDLRDKTTLMETVWILKQLSVLICNDSSPLHMAVAGDAFIGFIASVKHPDMITHWRKGEWGWRMKNFGNGGLWEDYTVCPNTKEDIILDKCSAQRIAKILPDPEIFGPWARSRVDEYFSTSK